MYLFRRRRLLLSAIPFSLLPASSALALTPPPVATSGAPIGLEPIVTGLGGPPLAMDYAPDNTDRLFFAGQTTGQIRLYQNGALEDTPFLDVTTAGVSLDTNGSEKGLLGFAFSPNFAAPAGTPGSGKVYTFTSEVKAGTEGVDFIHPELTTSNLGDCDSVIREWTVSTAKPNEINTLSRVVMRIRKPQSNHNGGQMRFGPDGYLYIGVGDGGGGNDNNGGATSTTDGHTSSTGNGQDNSQIYGKILRINPLSEMQDPSSTDAVSPNHQYHEPASNPFAGATAGLDEIYAYGLRNPWRFSFDSGGTHQLFAADVGQTLREEIDVVTNGGNYGWVYREGSVDNNGSGRTKPVGFTSIDPIAEYTHGDGQATIGGFVYRGSNIPELYGKYVFGELGFGNPNVGRLFYTDSTSTPGVDNTINEFTYAFNLPPSQLYSFGQDKNGELYAMFANGTISRLLGRQWMTNGNGSWNTSANWLLGTGETMPNAVGASANFFGRLTAGSSDVTLDGNKTVGALRFNNALSYTINPGTGGSLTVDAGAAGTGLVHVLKGNHTVNVPVVIPLARNTQFDVAAGAKLTLTSALSVGGSLTVTKTGAGSVVSQGGITFGVGTVNPTLAINGGDITLAPSSPASRLSVLSFAGGGRLDLTNNGVVIDNMTVGTWNGSTYTGVSGQIRSGRNGGAWTGSGFVTSQSNATTSSLTSIGIATGGQVKGLTGTQTAMWKGLPVSSGSTLVMYTYGGDANLDGKINVDDYTRIDFNVALGTSGWFNGDFNYDGKINVDDYTIIDFNVGIQGAPFPTGGGADGNLTAVPEPATLGLLLPMTALAGRRCRRRNPRLR